MVQNFTNCILSHLPKESLLHIGVRNNLTTIENIAKDLLCDQHFKLRGNLNLLKCTTHHIPSTNYFQIRFQSRVSRLDNVNSMAITISATMLAFLISNDNRNK